jgi:REP element-mobilizing transposase RayT
MRNRRRFLRTEIYFVTIRTVEQRFALDPYACPDAWTIAEGREIDFSEKQTMREEGQLCVERTQALTNAIAEAEKDPTWPRPVVPLTEYTDSIPNIIGACMARGIEMFGVHLYGFVWMSNHGHLLLRAPKDNFADFMAYLNGQIAVNVNRFLARKHQLWARRYAAAQVLDEAAELEMLGYLLANPQNAGIADSIEKWPGLSSATFFFEQREQRFLSFNRTAWREEGKPKDDIAPFLSTTVLEHKLLPQLSTLDKKKLRQTVRRAIKKQLKISPIDDAEVDADPMLPVRRSLILRTVIPTDRPESSKKTRPEYSSRQPICHTTKPSLRDLYKRWQRVFRAAYVESSLAYRRGKTDVVFPPGSFAPSKYPRAKYASDPDAIAMLHPTRTNLEKADANNTIAP